MKLIVKVCLAPVLVAQLWELGRFSWLSSPTVWHQGYSPTRVGLGGTLANSVVLLHL